MSLVCLHLTPAFAQRLVLVEEFTQASCPPCGQQNPSFNALLDANPDKVKSLKYQVSWPGYDPMNLQNPSQVATRVSYYGVNAVPWGFIDGTSITNDCGYYDGAPACLSQTDIDNEYAVPSPFVLSLSHTLSSGNDSIFVTLNITAIASVSGNLKARIAVVEKEIDFSSAPGANGETVFENVMKQMIPNTTGTSLSSTIDSGYTTTITASWKLANIYNLNELAVVAFIQDDNTKTIYQAAYSEPLPPIQIASVDFAGNNPITCDSSLTPSASLTNLGPATMTDATISYSVGNGTPQTYDWSGSLDSGASISNVQLPPIAVSAGSHSLSGTVTAINGSPFNGGGAMVSLYHTTVFGMGSPVATPVVQDFGLTTFPPSGWYINNVNSSQTWERSASVGAYQISPKNSAEYPFYYVTSPDLDEMYMLSTDLSDASQTEAYLKFDYAKAKYSGLNDELKILASSDCGESWTTLFDKDDAHGLSSVTSSADWKPTLASQWKTDSLDLSQFIGQPNLIIKFQAISGYGNNLYIDNINVNYATLTGISAIPSELSWSVYPNPTSDVAIVSVNFPNIVDAQVQVYNSLGQLAKSTDYKTVIGNQNFILNVADLAGGIYSVRLLAGNKSYTEKLVIGQK